MQDFVHLHVHTQYSILDGQASVSRLVDKAMKDGMRGMAITDHGNMMAIKEFFNYTTKKNSGTNADIKMWKKRIALLENGEDAALKEWVDGQKKKQKEADELRRRAEANDEPIPAEANFVPEAQPEFPPIADQLATARVELVAARKRLFKPIFGCEMYVAPRRLDQMEKEKDGRRYHLIVLAKNETGYHNLVKLVSKSWTDGFYVRPRTDRFELEAHSEGLIVCSACIAGEVPRKILSGDLEGAEEAVQWYKRVFGDNYYLELQRHEVKDPDQRANRETFPLQQRANAQLIELARKYDVKLVCTNDCHFVEQEDAEAHDRLICLSTNRDLDDPKRMLYSKQEWFKTRAEMNEVFADVPEALANTCDICDQVEFYSIDHAPIMPNFAIPEEFGTEEGYRKKYTDEDLFEEFTRDENGNVVLSREDAEQKVKKLGGCDKLYRLKLEADYLAELTYIGAAKLYGDPLPEHVRERINFELHVMKTMGFPGYFLIVQDFINWSKRNGVPVGPGRGSGAGSLVAYCLGITDLDPLHYGLLFERFLNPERVSMPDFDVDFCQHNRDRTIEYVKRAYGKEAVSQIVTFGAMGAKAVVRDVGRALNMGYGEVDALAKLIPQKPGMDITIDKALEMEPDFKAKSERPEYKRLMAYSRKLEGITRNLGMHAGGVLIAPGKLTDFCPLYNADGKPENTVSQYDKKDVEKFFDLIVENVKEFDRINAR